VAGARRRLAAAEVSAAEADRGDRDHDGEHGVSRAMIKLGARDRAQLVVFAYQAGLVTPRAAR
jgi:hypothetical protein